MHDIRRVDTESCRERVSVSFEDLDDAIDLLLLKWPLQGAVSKAAHYLAGFPKIQLLFQPTSQLVEL